MVQVPAVGVADHVAGCLEGAEGVGDGLFAGADGGAELVEVARSVVEGSEEATLEGGVARGRCGLGVADFEPQGVVGEGEGERWRCWGGAVFDGEGEFLSAAAQIEVGVAPGVEIGAAAQGLASGVAG